MAAVCVLHIIISECDILHQNPDFELYYIHSSEVILRGGDVAKQMA